MSDTRSSKRSLGPGLKGRLEELSRKVEEGKPVTTEDMWALTGKPVSARIKRIAESAGSALNWLRSAERKGSREHHALVNRDIIEALQSLEPLVSPPPTELIELIAYQLRVSGQPRNAIKDTNKWRNAIRLVAENPEIADRTVARLVGRDHKAIRAWRAREDFQEAVQSHLDWTCSMKALEEKNSKASANEPEKLDTET